MIKNVSNKMIEEIKDVIISSRNKVAYEVNNTMLLAYWNVGRIIVENEQNGNTKTEYGKHVLRTFQKKQEKFQVLVFRYQIFNTCEDFI